MVQKQKMIQKYVHHEPKETFHTSNDKKWRIDA